MTTSAMSRSNSGFEPSRGWELNIAKTPAASAPPVTCSLFTLTACHSHQGGLELFNQVTKWARWRWTCDGSLTQRHSPFQTCCRKNLRSVSLLNLLKEGTSSKNERALLKPKTKLKRGTCRWCKRVRKDQSCKAASRSSS